MPAVGAAANKPFECEVGLVQVTYNGKKTVAGDYITLKKAGDNVFETNAPVKPGTRFKMEIRNESPCYIYVFGKETDGSSYTLFPYPKPDDPTKTKYSPFCGIAGYRLFPKDKSMQPDSIGTRDEMAVIISKDSLNWSALNEKISQNKAGDYTARLHTALGSSTRFIQADLSPKGNIHFTADENKNGFVVCTIEVNK